MQLLQKNLGVETSKVEELPAKVRVKYSEVNDVTEVDVDMICNDIEKWKTRNPRIWMYKHQIARHFLPFIEIPHFGYVGNIEIFHDDKSSYKSLKAMKNISKQDRNLRLVVQHSSCTLCMALTMMQLRNQR